MTSMSDLADFHRVITELWEKTEALPDEMCMPKSQALALGADVAHFPDGCVVVLRKDGVYMLEETNE
jgi:hypothetical protein